MLSYRVSTNKVSVPQQEEQQQWWLQQPLDLSLEDKEGWHDSQSGLDYNPTVDERSDKQVQLNILNNISESVTTLCHYQRSSSLIMKNDNNNTRSFC
jgi:hypothetical protein